MDADLTDLLKEFGPPRQSYHPEYPFWRLQNDGVWQVHATGQLRPRQSSTDAKNSELLAKDPGGGFSPEVQAALRSDPALVSEIATRLLESHFPESVHPDILAAVGLDLGVGKAATRKRDPQFRQRVLTAYEYRCAVCGFDVRLGSVSIALDAAHIRWHQVGGPDEESNGLALCVLHHKTFDLGAFTIGRDGVMLVSDQAHECGIDPDRYSEHSEFDANRPSHQPAFLPQLIRVADDLDACVGTPGVVHPKDPVTLPVQASTIPLGRGDLEARPRLVRRRLHLNVPLQLTLPHPDVVPHAPLLLPIEPPHLRDNDPAHDEPEVAVGPDDFRTRMPR